MKKSIFHKSLYMDQLKQLRLIGFIGLGLLCLFSILYPIGTAISISNRYEYQAGEMLGRVSVDISSTHGFLYMIFMIIVPLLALACFHFLTQRNSSDFYHSLPHTRTCLFTCSIAAVFTWITMLVWIPTAVSAILYNILGKFFVLDIFSLLRFSLFIFIASLMVASAIALACSLTGTVLTNVIVTGMILFLPRIFILVLTELVTNASRILVSEHFFPLLDVQYNIIFGLFSSVLSFGALTWSGLLYSTVLCGVYLALGLIMFKHRKSEVANQAAISKKVQTIFRLFLGLTVSLGPISNIFGLLVRTERIDSAEIPMLIYTIAILYLVACIVMLLYELITTKKFRNVVKALPSIGILAILNVVVIVFSVGIFNLSMKFNPEPEDIDYVVIEDNVKPYDTSYYTSLVNSIEYRDENIVKLVSDTLKNNLADPDGPRYSFGNGEITVIVGIHTGFTTTYRRLFLSEEDYDTLREHQTTSKEYIAAYQDLPELGGNKLSLSNVVLDNKSYKELYDIAREEIKFLDFDQWNNTLYLDYSQVLDTLTFYATVNHRSLTGTIPISSILPKTTARYLELVSNSNKKDLASILTYSKSILKNGFNELQDGYMDCVLLDTQQNLTYYHSIYPDLFSTDGSDNQKVQAKELLEALVSTTKDYTNFDPSTDYIVTVRLYSNTGTGKNNSFYPFIVDKTKVSKLIYTIDTGATMEEKY